MDERLRILLIDDDEDEYVLLKELISRHKTGRTEASYDLDWVSNYEEAVRVFSACQHDLYLVDYRLGSRSGLDLLREARRQQCVAPIIVLTGQGNYEIDLAAMQLGAADYLEKNQLTLPLLDRSIRYAIQRARDLILLQKQAEEIKALQNATSSLLKTLDLSQLVGQILDASQKAIPIAEQSWLHLVEQRGILSSKLAAMKFDDPRIHKIRLSSPLKLRLKSIREGHSLLIDDIQEESELQSLFHSAGSRQNFHSVIIAPLILKRKFLGAISLGTSRPSAFSEADLRLLTSFAATASAAIHNAILHADTQELATSDPLTGQLNRRSFFEFGQREIERFQRSQHHLSALMFDVDNFKKVNDTYGHAAGDEVLIAVSDRCAKVIRRIDIMGRYGGDEFAILLPEADLRMAREIADRIRTSIGNSPVNTDGGSVLVSISIGIAQATHEISHLRLLLDKADQALYLSKQAGRNTITALI